MHFLLISKFKRVPIGKPFIKYNKKRYTKNKIFFYFNKYLQYFIISDTYFIVNIKITLLLKLKKFFARFKILVCITVNISLKSDKKMQILECRKYLQISCIPNMNN